MSQSIIGKLLPAPDGYFIRQLSLPSNKTADRVPVLWFEVQGPIEIIPWNVWGRVEMDFGMPDGDEELVFTAIEAPDGHLWTEMGRYSHMSEFVAAAQKTFERLKS